MAASPTPLVSNLLAGRSHTVKVPGDKQQGMPLAGCATHIDTRPILLHPHPTPGPWFSVSTPDCPALLHPTRFFAHPPTHPPLLLPRGLAQGAALAAWRRGG
jgi:hypothetical protein